MVSVAQLVEPRIVIPVVVGSSPIVHPSSLVVKMIGIICNSYLLLLESSKESARVAELVDALDLGSSRVTCESSSLSSRIHYIGYERNK